MKCYAVRAHLLQRQLRQKLPLLLQHQEFQGLMTAWVKSTPGAAKGGVHVLPSGLGAIAELLPHEEVVPAAQACCGTAMPGYCHAVVPPHNHLPCNQPCHGTGPPVYTAKSASIIAGL